MMTSLATSRSHIRTYPKLKGWKLDGYKDDPSHIPTIRQLLSHTGGTNIGGFLGYKSSAKNAFIAERSRASIGFDLGIGEKGDIMA